MDRPSLEQELIGTTWILEKVQASESYAQNLYAALCNQEWQKRDVMPILQEQAWGCSWRYAGGIIATMRGEGDYMDWYCSGTGSIFIKEDEERHMYREEGTVTPEIEDDLYQLGWIKYDRKETP